MKKEGRRPFFTWARIEGLAAFNPCESVKSPVRHTDEVSALSVADAEKLFATAWKLTPEVCARLAFIGRATREERHQLSGEGCHAITSMDYRPTFGHG